MAMETIHMTGYIVCLVVGAVLFWKRKAIVAFVKAKWAAYRAED